jgi:hypothetical protein
MRKGGRGTRSTVATGLLAAVLLVPSACSSSTDSDEARSVATVAPGQSGGEGEVAADEQPDLVGAMRATAAASSAVIELRVGGSSDGESLSQMVRGSIDFEQVKATLVVQSGSETMEARVDGERTWFELDAALVGPDVPSGARWLEAPTAELEERGVMSMDPNRTWAMLFLLVGAQNVRTRGDGSYAFDLDLDAIDEGPLTREQRAAAHTVLQFSDPEVFESVGGTVRLDGEGRVSELSLEVVGARSLLGEDMSLRMSLRVSELDVPVTVPIPPPEEVVMAQDHPELLERLVGPGAGYETADWRRGDHRSTDRRVA